MMGICVVVSKARKPWFQETRPRSVGLEDGVLSAQLANAI